MKPLGTKSRAVLIALALSEHHGRHPTWLELQRATKTTRPQMARIMEGLGRRGFVTYQVSVDRSTRITAWGLQAALKKDAA